MENNDLWEQIILSMEKESALLDSYAKTIDKLKICLQKRDWIDLTNTIKSLENMANQIESAEEVRTTLTEAQNWNGQIEQQIRNEDKSVQIHYKLAEGALKAHLYKVKHKTQSIGHYAEVQLRVGKEVMGVLCPSMRGQMYDDRGKATKNESASMVLSQHL